MKPEKHVVETRTALLRGYAALVKTKDPEKITVAELCRRAEVSRSTFYSHYRDLPDFLRKAEEQIAADIDAAFSNYHFDTDLTGPITLLLDYFYDNADIVFPILHRPGGVGFTEVYKAAAKTVIPKWSQESALSPERIALLFAYSEFGVFALIRQWWDSGFTIPKEELRELLENLFKYGVYNYVYTV